MPNWRDGLVEAFPVPEDRRPGWRTRARKAAALAAKNGGDVTHLEDAFEDLQLTPVPKHPFRFFDLPPEIRNRIYRIVLFAKPEYRLRNGRRKNSRLACMLASQKMHQEAAYILYTNTRFRIFYIQQFDAPPTIVELAPRYIQLVTNLEIIFGSSWTKPPKDWALTPALARRLSHCPSVQTLRVMVEFDPSHPVFAKYRVSFDFYTNFCGDLLGDTLDAMPGLKYVEIDGNPGVDPKGPLVQRLKEEAEEQNKEVKWGKQAGWVHRV